MIILLFFFNDEFLKTAIRHLTRKPEPHILWMTPPRTHDTRTFEDRETDARSFESRKEGIY